MAQVSLSGEKPGLGGRWVEDGVVWATAGGIEHCMSTPAAGAAHGTESSQCWARGPSEAQAGNGAVLEMMELVVASADIEGMRDLRAVGGNKLGIYQNGRRTCICIRVHTLD